MVASLQRGNYAVGSRYSCRFIVTSPLESSRHIEERITALAHIVNAMQYPVTASSSSGFNLRESGLLGHVARNVSSGIEQFKYRFLSIYSLVYSTSTARVPKIDTSFRRQGPEYALESPRHDGMFRCEDYAPLAKSDDFQSLAQDL
jgi:hypothetical protein